MMLLDVCDNGDVLSIMRLINIVISIIRIVVPIILIVSVMIGYVSAIKNNDSDALNKANKTVVVKVVAAILVFFIPNFVAMIADVTETNKDGYLSCLSNATSAKIDAAYIRVAERTLDIVHDSLKNSDYSIARSNINKVQDENKKSELLYELENVKKYIDLRDEIYVLARKYDKDKYKDLKSRLESISDSEIRERLLKELEDNVKITSSLGDFILDPSDALYKNLKPLAGISLEEVLAKNGSNVSALDLKIQQAVESVGVGTREAPVVAALTLFETLAGYGYHIAYFWGGKWNRVGVRGSWGTYDNPRYCDSHPNPSYCRKTYIYKGFDCSGFVNWAIAQGFQTDNGGSSRTGAGDGPLASGGKANCNTGDTLVSNNHIVLVVEPQDNEGRYLIAESTGGAIGTRLSYMYYGDNAYRCVKVQYSN